MRLFTSGIHKGDRKSLNKPKRFGKLIKGAATREGRRPSFFCDAGISGIAVIISSSWLRH
jgi:hypothetical protein